MSERVVWITGASSGIGRALAQALAAQGDRLVLSARRQEVLEEFRDSLPAPDHHLVLPLDVADTAQFASAIDKVKTQFGRLDVLVNNAGITQRSRVMDTDIAVFRRIMEVDFFGAIGLTHGVLPWLKQQGHGQIVVVTSLVGELPTPQRAGYSAAKHALHGWFESLRAEEGTWLDVLLVMPGFVRTEVSLNALEGDGSRHDKMDDVQANGMSAEACAKRILLAMQRKKPLAIIAGKEKAAVYLKRWFPAAYRFAISRVKVT